MTRSTAQLLAISALIMECENLAASGAIDVEREIALRSRMASVMAAFKIKQKFPDDSNVKKLLPDRTTLRLVVNRLSERKR